MTFTEAQLQWLETAQGKAAEFTAGSDRQQKKRQFFAEKIQKKLDQARDKIREAESFTLTWPEDKKRAFWKKSKARTMDSMTGDRDVEIDTVNDMPGADLLDPKKLMEVLEAHRQLVELQTQLENAKDDGGQRLFSDKEITDEFWTPLVRSEVVPSNAVGDKFSQEAQVFEGACKIYDDKLKKFSEKATGNESLLRALKIAKETINMMGSVATEAIKGVNFEALSTSGQELRELKIDKAGGDLTAGTKLDEITKGKLEALNQQAYVTFAVCVLNGGIAVSEAKLKNSDGFAIAQIALDGIAGAIKAGTDSIGVSVMGVMESGTKQNCLDLIQNIKSGTDAALAGAKVAVSLAEIASEPTKQKAEKLFHSLIVNIASAVGAALTACEVPAGKVEVEPNVWEPHPGTGGEWGKIGAIVKNEIIAAANAAKALEAFIKNDKVALIEALGLTVIGPIFAGTIEVASDGVRPDVSNDTRGRLSPFQETVGEHELRNKNLGLPLDGIANQQAALGKLISITPAKKPNSKELKEQQKKLQEEVTNETRQKALDDLKNTFGEEGLAELEQQIKDDPDNEVFQQLLSDARPAPDALQDEAAAQRAMAAIDKLIAEVETARAKWEMLDGMTKAGVGLVVSFLPVAGLAAAIRDLVFDTIKLVQRSLELNLWLDNVALTMGNSSVYGPAIQGRCTSSKIQVSYQAVRVVFDLIGVSAESCRLADCTGAATGIAIGNNLAKALHDYGYKMHGERQIDKGWKIYKEARANPGNRKLARKAMNWNSTLSKCVLAYGCVYDKDPIALEVVRKCGLTPEILADDKNVAQKVVCYFEALYSEDPKVLKVVPLKQDWHPGEAVLTLKCWLSFKGAALTKAKPLLDPNSAKTAAIDTAFAGLHKACGGGPSYTERRDALDAKDLTDTEYDELLQNCRDSLTALSSSLESWRPVNDQSAEGLAGLSHDAMRDVAESLAAQAQLLLTQVSHDLNERKALSGV